MDDDRSYRLTIAEGAVEESNLFWQIKANKRATNRDLRAIASLLIAAADRLESDPEAVDTEITA